MKDIGIIGIGRVGGLLAYNLLSKGYNVKANDVVESYARGQVLDLKHAFAFSNVSVEFAKIEEMLDSKVIVITAGFPRVPNETRANLMSRNRTVIQSILEKLSGYGGTIITVTNPVDAINTLAAEKFGREKAFGFGNTLDTARLVSITGGALDFVIGEHGENFVPILSNKNTDRDNIVEKVRSENQFVVENKKGTEYAPAYHLAELASAIAEGGEFTTYVSVLCNGEFGVDGISIGVPVRIRAGKLHSISECHLDDWERNRFVMGVESIKKAVMQK
ncbi:MAG: hypothetical protein QXS93_00110 [Candidatus Micrarchaeia archaeon]